MAGLSTLVGLFQKAAPVVKAGAGLGNKVLTGKGTLAASLGSLFAAEAIKQGAITPVLKATGIAPRTGAAPAVGPPPGGPQPMNMQEMVLYGSPGKQGLFGSSHFLLGGQEAQPGLLERRFEADNQFRNAQLNAAIESQKLSTGSDVERQRLVSQAQTILGGQQADRDKYSAKQNTLSNMSANMAMMVAGGGINTPTNYGATMVQNTQALATPTSTPAQLPGSTPPFGGRSPYGGYPRRGFGRRAQMGGYGAPSMMGGYGGAPGMGGYGVL